MSRLWVVNASPLILLEKAGYLHLLRELAEDLLIPVGVAEEVRVRPEGAALIEEMLGHRRVGMEAAGPVPSAVEAWDLGQGESEVLALALAKGASRAVLDDLEARRCAQALEIGVIGTLGIVLRAKKQGLVSAARPVLREVREAGLYVSDDLAEKALAHLGE